MPAGIGPSDGMDDLLQQDAERIRRLNRKGLGDFTIPKVMESVFWFACVATVILMMASMYWVGPDKPIPGHVWLGYSLVGIVLFGGLAMAMRLIQDIGPEADRKMTQRFKRGR